jgi:hypothetical protein
VLVLVVACVGLVLVVGLGGLLRGQSPFREIRFPKKFAFLLWKMSHYSNILSIFWRERLRIKKRMDKL